MFFEGKPICNKSPRDAIANGFSFVPEDRKDQGLILMADILSNVELNILKKVSCGGFMIRQKETGMVNSFVEKLEIKARNIFTRVGMLSGGNQQKVVIAKSLSSEPRIVLLRARSQKSRRRRQHRKQYRRQNRKGKRIRK